MKKYLYEDLYQLEDKHWWHISKRINAIDLLLKFLPTKNPKILDIGCGTGKNVEELSKIGPTWGIDNSKEAVKYCKKRGLKTTILGNAESTNLFPNSINVVTLFDTLEHTDDKKTLKEVYRILNSGDILLLTVPAFPWLWSKWDEVLHHKRRYTKKSISEILKCYNFNILKISYMFSFLVVPVFLIRLIKSRFYEDDYSSDFKINSGIMNSFLLFLAKAEKVFILRWSIPFGTSLICVAKK